MNFIRNFFIDFDTNFTTFRFEPDSQIIARTNGTF